MIYSYMIVFGLTSSVFDLITFYLLYKYFNVTQQQFRTGWFMESLATQILVIFVIRTWHIPFVQSKPSRQLFIGALICLAAGWLLPWLPLAGLIGFDTMPRKVIFYITGIVIIYLFTAEILKRMIYRRFSKQ